MIRAQYRPKYYRLTVKGHANADEPGKDLICAAASILVQTLAENLQQMEKQGALRDVTIRLEPGDSEIACVPGAHYRAILQMIFQTIVTGLEVIEKRNPEYMAFEIIL